MNHSQIQNLDRWGHPYLFSDFRFHMTLTGKVKAALHDETVVALRRAFQRMCGEQPIAIDRLALLKQDGAEAAFRMLSDAPLIGVHELS